jgi:hypothetical protein
MGVVDVADVEGGLVVDGFLLAVDDVVGLGVVVGHEGERAAIAGGVPGGGLRAVPRPVLAGNVAGGLVRLDGLKDDETVLDLLLGEVEVAFIAGENGAVVVKFGAEVGLGGVEQVIVVEVLDGGFEAERDEQADGDGEEMQEEVARGVDGFVRRVYVHDGAGSCGGDRDSLADRTEVRSAPGFDSASKGVYTMMDRRTTP